MRQLIGCLIGFFLAFGVLPNALGKDACQIGILDSDRFQAESVAFKKVRDGLKQRFDELEEKLTQEKDELRQIEEELKKQSMMLSLDAKENKRKELEKKRRRIKYLREEFSIEMKEAQMEAMRRAGNEIEKIVEKIGKREGYRLIIEKQTLSIPYFDETCDITDKVIKAYDQLKR